MRSPHQNALVRANGRPAKEPIRVYAGLHYPGDVVGGAIVGLGAAWVVVRFATGPLTAAWNRLPSGALGRSKRAA